MIIITASSSISSNWAALSSNYNWSQPSYESHGESRNQTVETTVDGRKGERACHGDEHAPPRQNSTARQRLALSEEGGAFGVNKT